jgi:molecular chaperone DnaJ
MPDELDDYYEILGVTSESTQEEIKSAYRRRAFELHPDRNRGDATAAARFIALKEAYECVGDLRMRRTYDREHGWTTTAPDMDYEMSIDSLAAGLGTVRAIRVPGQRLCTSCKGTGRILMVCPECDGVGTVYGLGFGKTCHACRGARVQIEDPCGGCHGSGWKQDYRQITFRIPPRTRDGQLLSIRPEGIGEFRVRVRVTAPGS